MPWVTAIFFYLLTWATVRADIKNPLNLERAPVPQPTKVTVVRGESVEITLNGLTSSNKDIVFILRSQPQDGKLLEVEPIRKTKSSTVVHYQSNAQGTVTSDSFKFAVRIEGGAVSPAETVQISIIDVKPEIEVVGKVDAGSVRIGRQVAVPITLKNTGNGPFNQPVLLPAGWSWENGLDRITVPAGKAAILKLVFRPTAVGLSEGFISFGNGAKSEAKLLGNGMPPIEVPGVVQLKWNPTTLRREFTVRMSNPSDEAISIKLESIGGKLQHPTELSLGPLEEKGVPLVLNEDPSKSFRESLALSARGMVQLFEVTAEPAPALVKTEGLDPGEVIDFGIVRPDQVGGISKELKLTNVGGAPVTLFGDPPSGFVCSGYENGMTLLPGSAAIFKFQVKPTAAGKLRNVMKWNWDNNPISFELKAEVSREGAPAVSSIATPTMSTSGPVINPLQSDNMNDVDQVMRENFKGILSPKMQVDSRIPKVTGLYQKSETKDSVTIAWPLLPGPEKYEYHVMERVIGTVNGFARQMWPPARQCTVSTVGDEGIAVLKGLEPGWANALTVSAKDKNGKFSKPSFPITFAIPYPKPFNFTPWLLGACTLALFFFWRHWKKKNAPLRRTYRDLVEEESR